MSMCQNDSSCTACCGTLNLKLSPNGIKVLLDERTVACPNQGVASHLELVEYRKKQEEIEASIKRYDASIYVCPFVGWIEAGRAGCLIHPVRTGRANSQNASFYGATICQNYDCRAKEIEQKKQNPTEWFEAVARWSNNDTVMYSRVIGDAMLYRFLEQLGDLSLLLKRAESVIRKLCFLRSQEDVGPTSFELPTFSKFDIYEYIDLLFTDENRKLALEAVNALEEIDLVDTKE